MSEPSCIMVGMKKINKKQMKNYESDFKFSMTNLENEIERYLEVAGNDRVSHNQITRTIALINWTSRIVSENRDELEQLILLNEE